MHPQSVRRVRSSLVFTHSCLPVGDFLHLTMATFQRTKSFTKRKTPAKLRQGLASNKIMTRKLSTQRQPFPKFGRVVMMIGKTIKYKSIAAERAIEPFCNAGNSGGRESSCFSYVIVLHIGREEGSRLKAIGEFFGFCRWR